ncbi:MAG: DTW domain-containing protein [Piptocephalis tieghemiana]|nr:MAG: DTW domain-containing protein [Piptocephalis tieghemiana]
MSQPALKDPAGLLDHQELWLRILAYLDPPSLRQLCLVCKRFRRLASANHVWKPWTLEHFPSAHPPDPSFRSKERTQQGPNRWKFTISSPKVDPRAYLNTLSSWKATYRADSERRRYHPPTCPTSKSSRQKHQLYPAYSPSLIQGTSRAPCTSCGRPLKACLCPILAPIQPYDNASCHILVLQHPKCQVSIGTLRILMRAFTHIRTICDVDFSPGRYPDLDYLLREGQGTAALLFPSSFSLDPTSWASLQAAPTAVPRTLIAIDGTWSHAKSLLHYNPHLLSHIPSIHLPSPPPSIFGQLKPEPKPHCVSTAEAVAQAIGLVCEGKSDAFLPPITRSIEQLVKLQKEYAMQASSETKE